MDLLLVQKLQKRDDFMKRHKNSMYIITFPRSLASNQTIDITNTYLQNIFVHKYKSEVFDTFILEILFSLGQKF